MRLFHMTSIYHLPIILSSGYLKLTESNISLIPWEEHAGPDVVWLTTSSRPGQGWADPKPGFEYVDKTRIIFDVEVPDDALHHWWEWAIEHGSTEHHMRALAATGDERNGYHAHGRRTPSDDWVVERSRDEYWVTERVVPWLEWRKVTDRYSGAVLWRNSEAQMKAGTLVIPRLYLLPEVVSHGVAKGAAVMIKPDGPDNPWLPTTIISEESGDVWQVGGDQAQADEFEAMTDEEKRTYIGRVAPSVNVMHDLMEQMRIDEQ